MSAPFKMKGHTLPGPNQASPAKNVADPRHPHNKKGEHVLTQTRTKTSVTKSKGGKSSTYNITNTRNNRDGSKTHTFTNDLGNSFKEDHSRRPSTKKEIADNKKSSPTKLAPLIAAIAPMVIKAVAGKAMEKKEQEK